MDEFEIIEKLKSLTNSTEVYHVTTFELFRTRPDGLHQEVVVKVMDRGPKDAALRYHVAAEANDGRTATGNSGPDLDEVLTFVHWFDLDK